MSQSSSQKNNWSRTAVVYQIYPRSFKDSNNDGIGDLAGIIEKLDYLNDGTEKSLGVTAIWINPVFPSPMWDFGYDISNYCDIDPLFGDLQTFDRLVAEAHKRGIKIIMDFVANHTSEEHPWFVESRSSKNNPKRDWYIWRDPKPNGRAPNNWLSVFGGSAWKLDPTTGQYYMHSFLSCQPDLNWRNPEVRAAMSDVLKFWLARGVDGFRSDAAYFLIKDDQFRDDPINPEYIAGVDDPYESLVHTYSQGRPELLETTNHICNVLGEHGADAFLMSEAYLELPQMINLYGACSNDLQAPLNFNLMGLMWDAGIFKKFVDEFEAKLDPSDWPNYVLGNHDRSRLATRLGPDRARVAAMLIFTLRGMPFIYYGDELGMTDVAISAQSEKDPFGKNVPGLDVGRDPERTPMQWDNSYGAGFTKGQLWLPVAPDFATKNVAVESADTNSMLSFYKKMIHFRTKSQVLLHGVYTPVDSGNESIFAFIRELDGQKILVMLNFTNSKQRAKPSHLGSIAISTHTNRVVGEEVQTKEFVMQPYEGVVIRVV